MEQIALKIRLSCIEILKQLFKDGFSDVAGTRRIEFYLKQIVFTYCNYLALKAHEDDALSDSVDQSIEAMTQRGLLSLRTCGFYRHNHDLVEGEMAGLLEDLQAIARSGRTNGLYERLLPYELAITPSTVHYVQTEGRRNAAGGYYTPPDLAEASAVCAIDAYVEDNTGISSYSKISPSNAQKEEVRRLLGTAQIADLSCGSGEFYTAIFGYVGQHVDGLSAADVARNLWGIDVDPIAIQLACTSVLGCADRQDSKGIISHFILGNPLIDCHVEQAFEMKTDSFAEGRIYATAMGLNVQKRFPLDGFNLIVGNPPWEKVRFEERKFFYPLYPEIASMARKEARSLRIAQLDSRWPELYHYYLRMSDDYSKFKSVVRSNPLLDHSLRGELNTYALFAEEAVSLLSPKGIAGLILKSAIATSPNSSRLFEHFVQGQIVREVDLFENSNRIFNIDSRERFCLMIFSRRRVSEMRIAVGLRHPSDLYTAKRFEVNEHTLRAVNPLTGLLPSVTDDQEFQFLVEAHKRYPAFGEVFPRCHFGRLVHLTAHSEHISRHSSSDSLAIYEGKFIEQYDARFSTFAGVPPERKYAGKATAKRSKKGIGGGKPIPESRYYIEREFWEVLAKNYSQPFSLCWRSLTSSTNRRATIATLLPRCPTCQSIQLLQTEDEEDLLLLVALFNSIMFDYFVRMNLSGIDLTQSVVRQVPVPPLNQFDRVLHFHGREDTIRNHIRDRVVLLYRNEDRLYALFNSVHGVADDARISVSRKALMSEIDILVGQAYGVPNRQLQQVASTFPRFYTEEEAQLYFGYSGPA